MKKVISARMDLNELAKARDGLLAKGIEEAQLDNISQILRLTFYYGLLALCDDPKAPATRESMTFVQYKIDQRKAAGPVTLNDLINKE